MSAEEGGSLGRGSLGDLFARQVRSIESSVTPETRKEARIGDEQAKTALELARTKEELKRLKHDRKLRKSYARSARHLAQVAVVFWIFMFTSAALHNLATGRPFLSDGALITLTAGATVNILAALLGVIRGLFPGAQGAGH